MASPRRPIALPSASSRVAPAALDASALASSWRGAYATGEPIDDYDEKTTVDDDGAGRRPDPFEEQTVSDRGQLDRAAGYGGVPPIELGPGRMDRGLAQETIEETTIDGGPRPALVAFPNPRPQTAVDEPTVEGPTVEGVPLHLVARPAPALDAPPRQLPATAHLRIIAGNDRGREFELVGPLTRIGRAVDNDVVLTDIATSRRHFVVELDDHGQYVVRDLGSGNGTLVNNARQDAARLRHGDRLEIGNTLIRFDCPQAATLERPRRSTLLEDDDVATIDQRAPRRSRRTLMPLPAEASVDESPVRAAIPPPTRPAALGPVPASPAVAAMPSSMSDGGPYRHPMAGGPQALQLTHPVGRPHRHLIAQLFASADPERRVLFLGGALLLLVLMIAAVATLAHDDSQAPGTPAFDPLRALSAGAGSRRAAPDERARAAAAPDGPDDEASASAPSALQPRRDATDDDASDDLLVYEVPVDDVLADEQTDDEIEAEGTRARGDGTAQRDDSGVMTRQRAAALYARKQFDAAAAGLRAAARRASRAEARALRSRARDYAQVGDDLARGNEARTSNPRVALAAFRSALAVDERAGGKHVALLRLALADVAPDAAASFMSQGRYEAAKRAVDTAASYGAARDPVAARVRSALERKAEEFYRAAYEQRSSDPKAVRALLGRILAIAEPDSPWYAKASAALNKAATRD